MTQISLFDGTEDFKIDKPIRLIELFAGYGSQSLALKYIGADFEHWRISEWAVKSIQAYKDMHFGNDNTDYSKGLTADEIREWLHNKISSDYSTPMTEQQINRLSEKQVRAIYNNMRATHNLGSITECNAQDLGIIDTDKYCYIMTYSFPCQDLSLAGQGKGMSKGSGTRSGMLWQVERLLDEMSGYIPHREKPNGKIFSMTPYVDWYCPPDTSKLPQILLMENVPQVVGSTGIKDFAKWIAKLESLGYKNYWQVLNAKDYGIPQNRERCFMISILGDYYYSFPHSQTLNVRVKDFLDKRVDEKYYLSSKNVEYILDINNVCGKTKRGGIGDRKVNPIIAKCISCRGAVDQRADVTNFVVNNNQVEYTVNDLRNYYSCKMKCEQVGQIVGSGFTEMTGRVYSTDGLTPSIRTFAGGNTEVKIAEPIAYDEQNGYLRKDGCVGTLTTDGSSPKHNNRIVEPRIMNIGNYNPSGHNASKVVDTNGIAPTVMENHGTITAVTEPNYRFFEQAYETLRENDCDEGDTIDAYNKRVNKDGVSPTITTRPEGFKTAILPVTQDYRIRKLTERECFRLMGVKQDDFENVSKNQSTSSLYHLAGDSIVTTCLMAIFGQLFNFDDSVDKIKQLTSQLSVEAENSLIDARFDDWVYDDEEEYE